MSGQTLHLRPRAGTGQAEVADDLTRAVAPRSA